MEESVFAVSNNICPIFRRSLAGTALAVVVSQKL